MKLLNDDDLKYLFTTELDELYAPVELAGMTIQASDMETIDPVMFRCSFNDWLDRQLTEQYIVQHDDGDYYEVE